MGRQQPRRVTARRHAQPPPRFLGMGLDRALADIEQTRHLLGLQMLGNQAQNLLLARSQRRDACRLVFHLRSPVRIRADSF